MKRPNILLIITDQQRSDYLGCAGHPLLKTPNIDALAQSGTRFENFYVANPICMPNRASLMTGRMSSLHGVRHNGIPLPVEANTFVEMLHHHGYDTALIGKSHLQNATLESPMVDRDSPVPGAIAPPPELAEALISDPKDNWRYDMESPQNWSEPSHEIKLPYYGFSHVDLALGHGDSAHGDYNRWLARQHPDPKSLIGPSNAIESNYVCPQSWRTSLPEKLHHTTYITDQTLDYLKKHAAGGKDAPFFIQCSYPDPHHPFTPPGRYWDLYDPDDVELPLSFWTDDADEIPPVVNLRRAIVEDKSRGKGPAAFAVTEREAREAIALTCGMISMIDDAVGRLLAGLQMHGLAENTIVIFTSDHGDFMGDHCLMLKGALHYQGLIRVPFIWAEPGAGTKPRIISELAATIDIARSILERAGIEPYNGIQGRSLIADIEGRPSSAPSQVLVEEDGQRKYMGFESTVRARTVVTKQFRMTIYRGVEWGVLHDLEADPFEMHNLWDEPAHRALRADLFERLAKLQMEAAETSPLPTAVA